MATLTINLDWTYEHFLTYVLFVVASADLTIDPEELKEIEKIVAEENTSNLTFEQLKEDVLVPLNLQSEIGEEEAFIKQNKDEFLTCDDKKEHIISCIEDVIASDLSIEENELVTYRTIKSILLGTT